MGDDTAATAAGAGASRKRHHSWTADLTTRVLSDRYALEREVGSGGFGVVFCARDLRLDKRVAVKLLSPRIADNPDALTRFRQEAIAAARIGHEGIVDVTDFGVDPDGLTYLVMEFIEGLSLEAVLERDKVFEPSRALALAARAAQALAAAHAAEIVHRDLKPGNLMITSIGSVSDFVKVLDFGISKVTSFDEANRTLTGPGEVVGTPRYMAPEQGIGSREIDGRVDVYALGTILYEMLTGALPYRGKTSYELVHLKVSHDALPPSLIHPALEQATDHFAEIDALVMSALARDPDKRFASMAEFEAAIRLALEHVDPVAASGVRPLKPVVGVAVATRSVTTGQTAETKVIGRSGSSPSTPSRALTTSRLQPVVAVRPAGNGALEAAQVSRRWGWRVGLVVLGGAALATGVTMALAHRPSPSVVAPPVAAASPPVVPSPGAPPVRLTLELEPRSARAELEGVVVAGDWLELPRSERSYALVVSAPGFESETRMIVPLASGEIAVHLAPIAKPVVPARPAAKKGPRGRLPDSPL